MVIEKFESMIKLIRNGEGRIEYWQAWMDKDTLVVHWGKVGETGQKKTRKVAKKQGQKFIDELAAETLSKGFRELSDDDMQEFIVQKTFPDGVTPAALDHRHQIEKLFDKALGWTGNGHCDGGDAASNYLTIYCFVIDLDAACEIAMEVLQRGNWENAVLGVTRDDEYIAIHPVGASILI